MYTATVGSPAIVECLKPGAGKTVAEADNRLLQIDALGIKTPPRRSFRPWNKAGLQFLMPQTHLIEDCWLFITNRQIQPTLRDESE